MDQARSSRALVRGIGVLAALVIAAGAISPAMSAAPLTKSKVKKIAKKQINKLVPGMIASQAVLKANYVIFKETLTFGQEKTLATNGPLTLVVTCRQEAGDDFVELLVRSTSSDWWTDSDNQYTAPGEAVLHYRSDTTGTESYGTGSDENNVTASSGGQLYYIGIDDYKVGLGLNVLGHSCVASGSAAVA